MYECPNDCGSTTFNQLVLQAEAVYTTEAGEPTQFEKYGDPEVKWMECAGCGAEVVDDE